MTDLNFVNFVPLKVGSDLGKTDLLFWKKNVDIKPLKVFLLQLVEAHYFELSYTYLNLHYPV